MLVQNFYISPAETDWVLAQLNLKRYEQPVPIEVKVLSQNRYASDSNHVICLMPREYPVMVSEDTYARHTGDGIVTEEIVMQ